ncbi:MAG: SH3 domain-containing protein, partial [Chloroflexota bacterium]
TVIRATVLFARSEPYLGADPVERVRRGETYQIVGRNPDATWFLIQLYGGQGWVWGYYIFVDGNAFDAPITNPFINEGDPANESALVVQSTAALKLRELPNVTAEQIGRVPWGEPLPVIGRTDLGQWYEVVYQDTVGWVYAPYTEIVEGSLNAVPITDPFLNGGIVIPAAAIPEFDISADNVQVIVVTNPPQLPTATSTPIFIIVTATPSPMP